MRIDQYFDEAFGFYSAVTRSHLGILIEESVDYCVLEEEQDALLSMFGELCTADIDDFETKFTEKVCFPLVQCEV